MNNIICPICGSTDVKSKECVEKDELPFGQSFSYMKTMHTCADCGEKGNFTGENDESYIKAVEAAKKSSLQSIIMDFERNELSMAYIERALDLPQRTLARWKTQGSSASGMALMRMIHIYPWFLKVADENFDKSFAKRELISQAAQVLANWVQESNIAMKTHVETSPNDVTFIANLTPSSEELEPPAAGDHSTKQFKTDNLIVASA